MTPPTSAACNQSVVLTVAGCPVRHTHRCGEVTRNETKKRYISAEFVTTIYICFDLFLFPLYLTLS